MRLRLERFAAGAEAAARRGDVVIIVDALRASVTVAAALKVGASRVIPVPSVEAAMAYLACPGCLVAGERGGARIPSFDYGNSPLELLRLEDTLGGRALILTTSNGTRCVAAASGASALLVGSLPNLSAVSEAALISARELDRDITVVATGWMDQIAVEDSYSARALGQRLVELGAHPDDPRRLSQASADAAIIFAESASGRRLANLGYGKDVAFCAQTDVLNVAPIRDGAGFVPFDPG